MEKISINLFRVSSDSRFLDAIIELPTNYEVSMFTLTANILKGRNYDIKTYDITSFTEGYVGDSAGNPLYIRIPIAELNIADPAIYEGHIVASADGGETVIETDLICSDVNSSYFYFLEKTLDMGDRCAALDSEVIKNYLILYAHLVALQTGEIETAKMYFKIIANNFSKCGDRRKRYCNERVMATPCNCGKL